jgi:hypothetical protein
LGILPLVASILGSDIGRQMYTGTVCVKISATPQTSSIPNPSLDISFFAHFLRAQPSQNLSPINEQSISHSIIFILTSLVLTWPSHPPPTDRNLRLTQAPHLPHRSMGTAMKQNHWRSFLQPINNLQVP